MVETIEYERLIRKGLIYGYEKGHTNVYYIKSTVSTEICCHN